MVARTPVKVKMQKLHEVVPGITPQLLIQKGAAIGAYEAQGWRLYEGQVLPFEVTDLSAELTAATTRGVGNRLCFEPQALDEINQRKDCVFSFFLL
jgi:hypothetical protein